MNDTLLNALMITEIIISVLLVIIILLQPGDEGLGGGVFGGSSTGGESFRTKRGFEKFLNRATIVLGVLFAVLSFIIVKYSV